MKKSRSSYNYIWLLLAMVSMLVGCSGTIEPASEIMTEEMEKTSSEEFLSEEINPEPVIYTLIDEEKVPKESVELPEEQLYQFAPTVIPALYITTDSGEEITSRDTYVSGTLIYDGELYEAEFRGRGNASWSKFLQKSYMIKLSEKESLIEGTPKSKKWVLVSNYNDWSLIRNPVAQSIADKLEHMEFTANQIPVDVIINGNYAGLYALSEKVETGKEKINLFSDESVYPFDQEKAIRYGDLQDSEKMAEITYEGDDVAFFFEVSYDLYASHIPMQDQFSTLHSSTMLLQSPEFTEPNTPEAKAIKAYLDEMARAIVYNQNVSDYLDLESWVDWFIAMEITCNTDSCFSRSTYFYKRPGEKVKMGPVWDFDMAFGNYGVLDNPTYEYWSTGEPVYSQNVGHWMSDLIYCEDFMELAKARMEELGDEFLEEVLADIDTLNDSIEESREYHKKKWGRCSNGGQSLKNFVTKRYNWIYNSLQMSDYNRHPATYRVSWYDDGQGNSGVVYYDLEGNIIQLDLYGTGTDTEEGPNMDDMIREDIPEMTEDSLGDVVEEGTE